MPSPATLFRLLNEFIILLLGALLIVLAISGRIGFPGRPMALTLVGIVLIYWGIRAWVRPELDEYRPQARIRAGSLVLVGVLILAILLLPVRDAEPLLEVAGGVLVLRGVLGGVFLVRRT